MSKDTGTAGGKASAPTKQPEEAGTPRTGFSSAPKGEYMTTFSPKGHGGSNKGAK